MTRTPAAVALLAVVFLGGCSCRKSDGDEDVKPDDTPVVRSPISDKTPKGCGAAYSYHYGNAVKTLREAEEYKPGLRDYYVRELSDNRNEYLLAAISPSERKEWLGSHKTAEKDEHCIVPVLEELAAAAKRTLPKYRPRGYKHHDSSEEKLIINAVKEVIPDAEVLAVGVKSPSWLIDKRSNGIPDSRYKYGMAWVKAASLDDGYCRILYVNIVQDYAGGESYGDSMSNYISKEIAGCE